ncbi:hypothetical protein MMC34_008043 [Xylographa carneopallida]|nr:hypothetical protein [Xylographa carneopallida]
MPASEELEKTLSAWTPNKVNAHEIWARLTPRERWSGLPQIPEEPAEVDRGSRLHKVLSGGGGWGNKKGLISLDPISRFRNSFVQSMFVEEENIGRENHDVLDHIARPGDSIQFFAFERTSSPQSTESPKTMKIHSPHTIRIGNTTSRQDAMPNAIANESSDPERLIAYGHFGALCESGIVLDIQLCLENATSYGNQAMGTVVQTKLPPLSSFCWRAKTVPNVSS